MQTVNTRIAYNVEWSREVENLYRRKIPFLNSTKYSIEEISAKILAERGSNVILTGFLYSVTLYEAAIFTRCILYNTFYVAVVPLTM